MLFTDGKNSRMRMKVQGRLMQARFIEIHQVFAKKKEDRILFQESSILSTHLTVFVALFGEVSLFI